METVFLNEIPMKLCGELPKAGEQAPSFSLTAQNLSELTLDSLRGSRVVLNIFPSIDTDVCAASVRHFNKEAAELPNTKVLCVSMDLPFAAARFCSVNGIENVSTASGFRSDFGKDYGVLLADGPMRGLYARALVVIDENGKVLGTSLKNQITEEPDYEFAISLLK